MPAIVSSPHVLVGDGSALSALLVHQALQQGAFAPFLSQALTKALSSCALASTAGPSAGLLQSKIIHSEAAPSTEGSVKGGRKSPAKHDECASKTSGNIKTHRRERLFGKRLSVVNFDCQSFLIGVQVATLLKRETFNMYRSMKIKSVDLVRATPDQVDFLTKVNAVRAGTHSVTLIPYKEGLYFIADARHKVARFVGLKSASSAKAKKSELHKSFIIERPKLHRRKAYPWNVHRAIRKEEFLQILKAEKSSHSSGRNLSVSSPSDPYRQCRPQLVRSPTLSQ